MARKMKDSGIEWIGEIPEGWEVRKIKNSFSIYAGATPKSENSDYWDGNIPWITPADYKTTDKYVSSGRKSLTELGYNSCGTTLVPAGSVIFSKRAPVGSVAIAQNDLCTNQGCLACTPRKNVNSTYFYYCMSTFTEQFELVSSGTTFKEIAASTFANFLLPCPPLSQQNAIVAFLDKECYRIDLILSKTHSSIEEYKKLKQAVITQAITKGVRGEREMKDSGIKWIGEIPEEWGQSKIKMVASFFNGDRTSRYPQPADFVDDGVAFLTSRNIDGDDVNLSEAKYITQNKYSSLSGAKIQINDVIFCLRGSVGKCAINQTLSCGTVASSLVAIRPKGVHPKYLLYFLLSNIASTQTAIFMNGTCAANLSAENVANYYITLPSSTEQKEIADYLNVKCAEIDKLIAKKAQLVKKLESYKKSLIYEVVTGKREV